MHHKNGSRKLRRKLCRVDKISIKNYQKKLPKVFTVQKRCRKKRRKRKKEKQEDTCQAERKKKEKKDDNDETTARKKKHKQRSRERKMGDKNKFNNQQERKRRKIKRMGEKRQKHHCRAFRCRNDQKTQQPTKLTFSFSFRFFSSLPFDSPSNICTVPHAG